MEGFLEVVGWRGWGLLEVIEWRVEKKIIGGGLMEWGDYWRWLGGGGGDYWKWLSGGWRRRLLEVV